MQIKKSSLRYYPQRSLQLLHTPHPAHFPSSHFLVRSNHIPPSAFSSPRIINPISSIQCCGRAALRLASAREMHRASRPAATTNTTQKTTMTPASRAAQFFRFMRTWLTASRASRGVRTAIFGNCVASFFEILDKMDE